MKKRCILILYVSYFCCYCILPLFSDEASYELKKSFLDTALENRDPSLIQQVKEYDTNDEDYEELINYLIERSGDLVFQEEYDYAYELLDSILYNNLDNAQAQDLYLLLNEIIKEQEEEERLAAEAAATEERLRQEEEARLAEEQRLKEEELAKEKAEEEAIQAALDEKQKQIDEAEAYQESISTITTDQFSYYGALFPIGISYFNSEVFKESNDDVEAPHLLYGLGAQLTFHFDNPILFMNVEVSADYGLLDFGSSSNAASNLNLTANYSLGSAKLPIPLALRVGYMLHSYGFEDGDSDNDEIAMTSLSTVSAGIGIWHWTFFEKLKLDLSFDYYFSSLTVDYLDYAFGTRLGLSYDFYENEKIKLFTTLTGRALFFNEVGLQENNFNGQIGVGVSFND